MTDKEIVQALRCCASGESEKECPFTKKYGCDGCPKVSADLIERLTAENAGLRKELEWKGMVIALAQREQAKAETERDALIEQIKERHDCLDCKHNDFCEFDGADDAIVFDCMNCVQEGCPCAGCCDSSRWEWRGLPEATEEE
nr:MAG TPA: hypothetical protein [Caudoviricetes sp.]